MTKDFQEYIPLITCVRNSNNMRDTKWYARKYVIERQTFQDLLLIRFTFIKNHMESCFERVRGHKHRPYIPTKIN